MQIVIDRPSRQLLPIRRDEFVVAEGSRSQGKQRFFFGQRFFRCHECVLVLVEDFALQAPTVNEFEWIRFLSLLHPVVVSQQLPIHTICTRFTNLGQSSFIGKTIPGWVAPILDGRSLQLPAYVRRLAIPKQLFDTTRRLHVPPKLSLRGHGDQLEKTKRLDLPDPFGPMITFKAPGLHVTSRNDRKPWACNSIILTRYLLYGLNRNSH